jgi:prephenate dehydratase
MRKIDAFFRRVALVLLTLLAVLGLPGAVAAENSIAFLGPKGSYSDQAASEYVSRADLAGAIPFGTITQIALSVRNEQVQYGLLPFENSIGGFVGETHRLLLAPQDPGWHVIADVTISISNNLLVKPGTRPSDLRKIISHPEALRESANWLKANTRTVFLSGAQMESSCVAMPLLRSFSRAVAQIGTISWWNSTIFPALNWPM